MGKGRAAGRVGSGRVGSGQRFAGSDRVGSKKSDPWTNLGEIGDWGPIYEILRGPEI